MYRKKNDAIELIEKARQNRLTSIKSYELAELLNKQHKAILRDIRQELERTDINGIDTSKIFIPDVENDYRNRPRTIYIITAQGILHLLARYGRYDSHLRYHSADSLNDSENVSEHLYSRK